MKPTRPRVGQVETRYLGIIFRISGSEQSSISGYKNGRPLGLPFQSSLINALTLPTATWREFNRDFYRDAVVFGAAALWGVRTLFWR